MWSVLRVQACAVRRVAAATGMGLRRGVGGGGVGAGRSVAVERHPVTRITAQGGTPVSGGAARDDVYGVLVARAQEAYLDAVEGQTDARVRSRLLLITRLLKRWQRGW